MAKFAYFLKSHWFSTNTTRKSFPTINHNQVLLLLCSVSALFFAIAYWRQEEWRDQVHKKLVDKFLPERGEEFGRIMWHLADEELKYQKVKGWEEGQITPSWRALKNTLNHDVAFVQYAVRLAADIHKDPNQDDKYRKNMKKIYSEIMVPAGSSPEEFKVSVTNLV